jgi:hypothetical protein
MMESIMQVAASVDAARVPTGPRDKALREARTCYDHLAGRLGVALADALVRGGYAELAPDAGMITDAGADFLNRAGIDLESLRNGRGKRRVLCRACLDWSERRPHVAGALGAALCTHSFAQGWIRPRGNARRSNHAQRVSYFSRALRRAPGLNAILFSGVGAQPQSFDDRAVRAVLMA